MLEAITLTNWRSHASTHLKLSRGTNLLLGPMGSGKSSVMDALCFALYGTYPKLGRRDVSLEDVANFRHVGQTVSVEVEWSENREGDGAGSANGASIRKFKVRRELSPAQAWMYIDEKLVQKGPRAVSEEVERQLQISYDLFARAVYSEQNRLDYWLALGPGQRKQELDRLLGLEEFERARAGAVSESGRLRSAAEAAEAAAPAERWEAAKKTQADRDKTLVDRKAELEKATAHEAELGIKLVAVQQKFEEGEKLEKQRIELEGQKQKISGVISTLEQALSGAAGEEEALGEAEIGKALEWAKKERGDAEKKQKEAQAAASEAGGRAARLGAQLKAESERGRKSEALSLSLSRVLEGRTLEALRAEDKSGAEALAAMLAEEARLEGARGDVTKLLDALGVAEQQISPAGGSGRVACPVCKQPLDTIHQLQTKKEKEEEAAHLAERIEELRKQIRTQKMEQEKRAGREAEASRLSAQLSALLAPLEAAGWKAELEAAQKAGAQLQTEAGAALERLRKLDGEIRQLEERQKARERREKQKKQLDEARGSKRALEEKLTALKPLAGWNELVREREGLLQETAGARGAKQSLNRLVESEGQLLESAVLVVRELEARRAEAAKLRAQMDEMSAFRSALGATQTQLRSRLLEQINAAMGRLWPLLYPYGDWTGVRIVGGEKDYAVEILQGKWLPLEAHASGGERACLGLALRAALSLLLTPQLGWLILDEPTHNLDNEAVQTLGRALSEKMPGIIEQVMVITHEAQLLESTPARVLRFSRDKTKGEDTVIEAD